MLSAACSCPARLANELKMCKGQTACQDNLLQGTNFELIRLWRDHGSTPARTLHVPSKDLVVIVLVAIMLQELQHEDSAQEHGHRLQLDNVGDKNAQQTNSSACSLRLPSLVPFQNSSTQVSN